MVAIKVFLAFAMSAQASGVFETSSAFRAKMWMKSHDQGDGDEAGMTDLKNSDPNAYAIVQALLTKKSLGLLDPSHPNAAFGATAPRKHKSFQEEAEEQGLTQDTPSKEVSEMEVHSSMPYPSVGSSASVPYPELSGNNWNSKTTHSDDDLVNSVIGADAATPAQPESDNSLSLSAVAQQEMQSVPAPIEHAARPEPAPVQSAFAGMPSLNWGSPMAGEDSQAPVARAAQPVAAESDSSDQILSLSAVRNQEASKLGITVDSDIPVAPVQASGVKAVTQIFATLPEDHHASLAAVAAPVRLSASSDSYLNSPDPFRPSTDATVAYSPPVAAYSAPSAPKLEMSTFSTHMGYRMNMHASDATPQSTDILSLRKMNMGNSYQSFLKQARTNRWKRAMDVTLNMKPIGGPANNAYLNDLS